MNGQKALVLLSGGLDSATCLYWAKQRFSIVYAITFNYHDRSKREREAAIQLAHEARITNLIKLDVPFMKENEKRNRPIRTANSDSRWSAYIPARNLMFYSIALYHAENLNITSIVGGHNRHDGYFFKDATQKYMQKLALLFREGSKMRTMQSLSIILPLCNMHRKNIISLAVKLKVPIELTWSCHNDGRSHCRNCYACIERLESFRSLGIKDPVLS